MKFLLIIQQNYKQGLTSDEQVFRYLVGFGKTDRYTEWICHIKLLRNTAERSVHMADKVNISMSGGTSFMGLLFLVFLVLKLTHVIDWSWWWVTAPLWGVFALWAIAVVIAFVFIYRN